MREAAVPTGIEPASTLLDRQAAYPDAYGTFGVTTRTRTGTGRFTASHANRYTMATIDADRPTEMRTRCAVRPARERIRPSKPAIARRPSTRGQALEEILNRS